jgi:hypothetical protein
MTAVTTEEKKSTSSLRYQLTKQRRKQLRIRKASYATLTTLVGELELVDESAVHCWKGTVPRPTEPQTSHAKGKRTHDRQA